MAPNASKRHHYVPQFYFRRFVCADDKNKVMVVERYRDWLVVDRKSIDRIGYEESLHDYIKDGEQGSIESEINDVIETPFSIGTTWSKIVDGEFASLGPMDGLSIYGFARHLQRRNLQTLRFIEAEHMRFLAGEIEDLTDEEREMHQWLAQSPDRTHQLFREATLDTMLPDDAYSISVMVCRSPILLRTSTNPTIVISYPGRKSLLGEMFNSLRTWWLTLDGRWGAFIVAGGPSGFSNQTVLEPVARVINRLYLIQLLNGDARYMLADDPYLEDDFRWAGFALQQRTTHGFRYRALSTPGEGV